MTAGWRSARPLAVLGTGHALPGAPVETDALIARMVDRFGFVRSSRAAAAAHRLGIRTRHFARPFDAPHEIAAEGHANEELAARAVRDACDAAGIAVSDLGYLIGHTTTPTSLLPAGIAAVADLIGYDGPHVELRQACTGFANALMIADGLIAAGIDRPVAIVGSETGSLHFDPRRLDEDHSQIINLMQMGDGAGAIILAPGHGSGARLEAAWFGCVGRGRSPGIALKSGAREFDHDAAAVLRSGPQLFEAGAETAASLGHAPEHADWIIPHQVSGRIGPLVAERFGGDPARVFIDADRLGNTGSAAILIALDRLRAGPICAGQTAVALGAEASKFMFGGFAYAHG